MGKWKSLLFLEKRKQKNFDTLGLSPQSDGRWCSFINKKFFASFFQKRHFAYLGFLFFLLFACSVWRRSTFINPRPTSIMTDRNGVFMAQLGAGPGGYGYWPVEQVPDRVAAAILALEDRRFWSHPGVDPIAVARALRTDLVHGRRVSGASTLAMQVARMQHPESRWLGAKVMEAATAVVMTARYGRLAVLQQYLRLVPFGQDSHGIGHAARWYFDKPVADLSWAEIAFLSAIPQSPGVYNPDNPRGLVRAKARARLALERLRQQGVIGPADYAEALDDLGQLAPRLYPDRERDALHAILEVAALSRDGPPVQRIHSTIDLGLERMVTAAARQRLAQLQADGARQVAVILADRASMDVLALVGSGDYGKRDDGEIDYALRWRSPGSTLKPFIFAQALDRGAITPGTVLLDAPDSGTGVDNADRRFFGPMLPEQALGNSRNVPAAALVRLDGLDQSHWFLAALGLHDDVAPAERYGLTLSIGGLPTELWRLVTAYGALANEGELRPLRWYVEQPEPDGKRVLTADTARTVTLFLSDPMARLPSFARMGSTEFPFPVAVKTGTSQGYRDAWVAEFTDKYVIGVWVGRPDGSPMDGLGGASSAALIGRDILMKLYATEADGLDDGNFPAPVGSKPVELCATTGMVVGPTGRCAEQLVEYLPGGVASEAVPVRAPVALRIVAPLNRSDYILNPDAPVGLAVLPLRVNAGSGAAQVEWYVDGRAFQVANAGDTVEWPAVPGRHVFEVGLPFGAGRSKPVQVTVR